MPLRFWYSQASAKGLPNFSFIARSVYAITATQNKSERASGGAGRVEDHVEELFLISSHYKQACNRAADKDCDENEENEAD
jgi:hypothetical protein